MLQDSLTVVLFALTVQLPSLIVQTSMDADAVNLLREYCTEFLKFLAKNKKEYFSDKYGGFGLDGLFSRANRC